MQSVKFKQTKTVKAFTGSTVLAPKTSTSFEWQQLQNKYRTKLKIFEIQRAMVWFIDSIPILIQRRLNLNPTRTRSHNLLNIS